MEYFVIAFGVVFPILFYMALGVAVRKAKLLNAEAFRQVNRLVLRVFLPIKLFLEIYQSDFTSVLRPGLILYGLATVLAAFAVSWRTVGRFVKDRRDAPTLIQMLYRANYVLFGLSIAENMYPGQNLSIVSVLAAFVVPMFNILAVILFEVYRGGENISLARLLLGVLKNPLVIGSALGLWCNGLGLPLPQLLQKPLQNLGAIATPLALVCTGATLTFGGLRRYRRCLMWATAGRLVILPGIFLTLAVMMGFRGMELTALFLIYACPVAASSYPMAVELGGNGELAGLGVAVSHVACLVTIFLWIAFLNFFALC